MTVLPIVERELRVAARRRGTHALRLWFTAGGVLILILGIGWMERRAVPVTEHGRLLFRVLMALAFVYCLLAGIRATADSVSEEKRDGTLGLLFLTDLKGLDVVLGKLVAGSLSVTYGLLALLPVIFLPLQMGGVTGAQVVRGSVLLLNTLFLSVVTGMWVSSLSRDERKALFAAFFVMGGFLFGPVLVAFAVASHLSAPWDSVQVMATLFGLSPGFGLWYVVLDGPLTGVGGLGLPVWFFWGSQVWVHCLAWVLLVLTCSWLPRTWHQDDSSSRLRRWRDRWYRWLYGTGEARALFRRRLMETHPFTWLALRERGKPAYAWGFLVAVFVIWALGRWWEGDVMLDAQVALPMIWLVGTFFRVWVVSEACTRLCEDRRSGALELLLSTPMADRELVRGQWLALRRQFLMPLIAFVVLEWFLVRYSQPEGVALARLVMRLAEFMALGWVGMWLGLTARSLTRAIMGTVGLVLVLPWVVSTFVIQWLNVMGPWSSWGNSSDLVARTTMVWLVVGLANHAGWGWFWARRRLRTRFRDVASRSWDGKGPRLVAAGVTQGGG
jgi:ABC-type transport system involved in cytochrome c biogenesis permease component